MIKPPRIKESDDMRVGGDYGRAYAPESALRDTSAPCASGDKCILTPPSRVEIRGEQCGAWRRVQRQAR